MLGQMGLGESLDVDSSKLKVAVTATQRMLAGGLLAPGHDRSDGGSIVTVHELAYLELGGNVRAIAGYGLMTPPVRSSAAWVVSSSPRRPEREASVTFVVLSHDRKSKIRVAKGALGDFSNSSVPEGVVKLLGALSCLVLEC